MPRIAYRLHNFRWKPQTWQPSQTGCIHWLIIHLSTLLILVGFFFPFSYARQPLSGRAGIRAICLIRTQLCQTHDLVRIERVHAPFMDPARWPPNVGHSGIGNALPCSQNLEPQHGSKNTSAGCAMNYSTDGLMSERRAKLSQRQRQSYVVVVVVVVGLLVSEWGLWGGLEALARFCVWCGVCQMATFVSGWETRCFRGVGLRGPSRWRWQDWWQILV